MNKFKMLVSAIAISAVISSAAFARDIAPSNTVTQPVKVVSPTGLPKTAGKPSNIQMESHYDRALARSVIPAVAQWRFVPVVKDGHAVSLRVIQPITFVVKS
jgi:polyisoprenoid-binding protein YceI